MPQFAFSFRRVRKGQEGKLPEALLPASDYVVTADDVLDAAALMIERLQAHAAEWEGEKENPLRPVVRELREIVITVERTST